MSEEIYRKLARVLDTLPNGFPATDDQLEIRLLKKIFDPDQAELFCDLRLVFETAEQVAERTGRPLEGLEEKLKDFEARKQEIIEQYKAEGAEEKEKIIQEARERARQMLAQADVTIQREMHGAIERLKQEVVEAAAQKAQEIISRDISDSDQERLVNEFIERVGKVN